MLLLSWEVVKREGEDVEPPTPSLLFAHSAGADGKNGRVSQVVT
jgi:hypothetical protein